MPVTSERTADRCAPRVDNTSRSTRVPTREGLCFHLVMIPGERARQQLPQRRPEMPKYCSAPDCVNDSGSGNDGKSFYKFPLQDPARLQQWLRNMGREHWTPSRHQYICHEHFEPSCFKVRWGIRYLESDAVPTVFPELKKRKAADPSEREPKRLRSDDDPSEAASGDRTKTLDAAGMKSLDAAGVKSESHTVQLYEIAVETSQPGETGLVEWRDVGESDRPLQTDSLVSVGLNFPLTLYQMGDGAGDSDLLLVSAGDGPEELLKGITAAVLGQGGRLVVADGAALQNGAGELQELPGLQGGQDTEVIAYFEAIPSVFPCETSPKFTSSPNTVLSSALSSEPISSTLPITSKHVAPPAAPPAAPLVPLVPLQGLDGDADGDEGLSETDDPEQQDQQLEEHCYHRSSLNKEQLEAVVAELQKKVKVLQQRHRRHLEKLLGLENVVGQLRQSNLLNEERLQLLERAYIQGGVATAADAGETVAIIYEEDNAAYLYTPLKDAETML
ncbi:THAP domain-containing protein 5-like [Cololabis saira]|uniref:THAP domain-containing protein 5-like n=1 Tax=Cololabis saira TaxID=129043 RepID=UPI002AD3B970|nr:THAP domain-containing protein 5-like [Cololabis saira]